MEHRKKGRKLKRTASHKKAMMANMSASLIKAKRINTTVAKAKELKIYIEPLVTKAKNALSDPTKSVHLRRVARRFLRDDAAVAQLFNDIAPMVGNRPGGYTRVVKAGFRKGDGGDVAIIEFVDFNYVVEKEKQIDEKTKAEDSGKTGDKKETKKEVKAKKESKKAPKKESVKKESGPDVKTRKTRKKV
ncbi:MAG TPA: 50S ribosomal protein L17 [Ignavibacteria bacterium]|nr:50S ribosomal protein L17 [Ignavibacteria bacterium]